MCRQNVLSVSECVHDMTLGVWAAHGRRNMMLYVKCMCSFVFESLACMWF